MRALALLLPLVVLAGCVGPPVVTPVPTPTATPVFASDEEALAAAEEAYAAYVAVEDAIAQEGGLNPQRLKDLVTEDWLTHETDSFAMLAASGRRQLGETTLAHVELQQFDSYMLVAYFCVDFTGTSFVDADGQPVDTNGPDKATIEAAFEVQPEGQLLLSRSELWSQSIC